ncbi:hypothetical protein BZL33_23635 [Escherichia coli]|nr:hypothetical protein [Escherichia coli]OUK47276.1 hypothetical protein BZL33_23635 [Escherichia coli]RQN51696.1 hypothetical protein C3450_24615 [Escherichia coli]
MFFVLQTLKYPGMSAAGWFLHTIVRNINHGWKSFNTRTIESSPASRSTLLPAWCLRLYTLPPETGYLRRILFILFMV